MGIMLLDMKDTLGERLRRMRAESGLSQSKLAARSGVDPMTISRTELGKTNPGTETLQLLAAAMSRAVSELLGDTRTSGGADGSDDAAVSAAIDSYLASPRGRTTAPEVAERLRDRAQTAFRGLDIEVPSADEIDDVRRIWERRLDISPRMPESAQPKRPRGVQTKAPKRR
jgi:transcriptional regulator with XRE-family HTH domain